MYAGVAALSFCVTKIFSHMAKKVEKYRLVSGAYATIIICKLLLGNWLTFGGKPAVVCFYFFASVYFLLAVATLWACINDMFSMEQGERCFGFIALGSTIGSILGSKFSALISRSEVFRDYTLYFSIVFLACALSLVLLASRTVDTTDSVYPEKADNAEEKKSDAGFWSELQALAQRTYIRRIALTVLLLAVATTAIEFVSQTAIDRELAKKQHTIHFADIPEASFQDIYQLKTRTEESQQAYLTQIAAASNSSLEEVENTYEGYQEDLEVETRAFFSDTYFYQGIAGVFSLLIVARILFPLVGMRYCYAILPILSIIGLSLFGITVDLFIIQVVIVLVGSVNYSLNNAAKEILYAATDEETLFRFKPMIEGPCMRAGDVVSSILKLSVAAVALKMMLSDTAEIYLFLVVTIVILLIWLRCAWLAGKEYDFQRKAQLSSPPNEDDLLSK